MKIQEFIDKFRAMEGKGAKFIAFIYTNKEGEVSKRTINIGVSYENMLKKDIETLPTIAYVPSSEYTKKDWDDAMSELKESLEKRIVGEKNALSEGQTDAYLPLTVGLRWHIGNSELHITGVSHRKEVVVAGVYKVVKSRPKTIAKKAIESNFKSSKYRTFIVKNLSGDLKVNGEVIEIS